MSEKFGEWIRITIDRDGRVFLRVLIWLTFLVLVFWLLSLAGFARWTIEDVLRLADSWPLPIAAAAVVVLLIFFGPLGRMIDRVREATLEKLGLGLRLDPSNVPVKPPITGPEVPNSEAEEAKRQEELATTTTTTEDPNYCEPNRLISMPLLGYSSFNGSEFTPASWHAFLWVFPIRPEDLMHAVRQIPQLRPFTYDEFTEARVLLLRSDLDYIGYVEAFLMDSGNIELLDQMLSEETDRPKGKAIDVVSLFRWGLMLWGATTNPTDMENKVRLAIRAAYDAGFR